MRIISTNLGKPTPITWNGEQTTTGIYKYPVNEPIFLNKETVNLDNVSNRSVHGGEFKACYLFSTEQYPYWQAKYPDLEWEWGMFGENLTVEGLDEKTLKIGNIYKVGSALVQVTQPREPCFKLGIRFKDQNILKEFIDHGYPGTYVRVLEIGEVHTGDEFELVEESSSSLTTHQFYDLLYSRKKDPETVQLALENEALPERKRAKLKRFIAN
ncbi:MOSC domain-containing protein [Muricauda sp. 2012CJ35-5]|uniref:MOSC domain-containing protein n=1 Tax=Flagellimonas spongiicola TaxID=2942208 RepID=A0ABT0PWA0_9FLAO|nr:MOSC domain-containing protein [Allomuricauda spongiicola]MCL6275654.1 MOSC domain-containing protein [Allomuricauda spongiicola]